MCLYWTRLRFMVSLHSLQCIYTTLSFTSTVSIYHKHWQQMSGSVSCAETLRHETTSLVIDLSYLSKKSGGIRIWTRDLLICSQMLYHWAIPPTQKLQWSITTGLPFSRHVNTHLPRKHGNNQFIWWSINIRHFQPFTDSFVLVFNFADIKTFILQSK